MRWRFVKALLMLALLTFGSVYALASWDWCPRAPSGPSAKAWAGEGAVRAGAGHAEFTPSWPVSLAGYGPMEPQATQARRPAGVRALVLEVGGQAVALVSLELLLVPQALAEQISAAAGMPALVFATHPHTSLGGYDARVVSQLGGVGRYRPAVERMVVAAAREALAQARAGLRPARLAWGLGTADGLNVARSGARVDARVLRLDAVAEGGAPIARLLLLAAHPTLVPWGQGVLDADWPAAAASAQEAGDAGVTVFGQLAVGNASALLEEGESIPSYAQRLSARVDGIAVSALEGPLALTLSTRTIALPHPDASRLVPWFGRKAGENLLCRSQGPTAEVSLLGLGPLRLAFVPAEVTAGAAAALEAATGATLTVSLSGGYVGYLEARPEVEAGTGESLRQYYGPSLVEAFAAGLAADAGP